MKINFRHSRDQRDIRELDKFSAGDLVLVGADFNSELLNDAFSSFYGIALSEACLAADPEDIKFISKSWYIYYANGIIIIPSNFLTRI